MSWAVGSSGGTRPPRPLLEVTEQLAQAAAADFTTRLAELVIDDSVGGPTGVSAPTAHVDSADGIRARSASNAGGGIAESEMEKAEAEELAVLRSRMTALASVFADRFNTSVDEQVMALWNKRDDVADGGELGTLASGLPLKKGSKLRRSFKKKFGRRKGKATPEEEAERKQLKKLEKEGQLKQLVELDGTQIQWVKCRVTLKRQPGGFMLSFFSPPKSQHPRSGIFCFLITEVRQTTHEELPNIEHSFVVRGINNMEYILLCHGNTDMWSWIAALRECSRLDSIKRNIKKSENGAGYVVASDDDDDDDAPPLPPPPDTGSSDNLDRVPPPLPGEEGNEGMAVGGGITMSTSTSSLDNMTAADHDHSAHSENVQRAHALPPRQGSIDTTGDEFAMEHIEKLYPQPWFHGLLSRQEATMLVCQGATQAHGTFLVRQSESRQGQLVLTFNCRGRAKHMRLTVLSDGQCRAHQWTFDNVFHMLDYFKLNSVPLESGAESDVVLSSFVVSTNPGLSPTGQKPFEPSYVNLPKGAKGATSTPGPAQPRESSPAQPHDSPTHLPPNEGSHPMYANDVFPGGVMIAPPSIQALHERTSSNPAMMPPASDGSPTLASVVAQGAMRIPVTPTASVPQPRSVSADNAVRSMPLARPSNHYQLS